MLPRNHIYLGLIFSIIIYLYTPASYFQASLVFFASFLIDFDHYVWYVLRKKDFSLKNAYYFLKGISGYHKPTMMFIHTIEFHIFTGLLIFFWSGFFFVLLGMVFHSILDIFSHMKLSCREFSLIKYIILDKEKYL